MSPFMALYGYHPPSITSPLIRKAKVQEVDEHIEHQQKVLQLLKDKLAIAKNRMKRKQINITLKGNLKWELGIF
jgi:hypothetical protein